MKEYFEVKICDLQNAVKWSLSFAEKALCVYEKYEIDDSRAKEAILGAIAFYESGTRTNELRKLAMSAYKASRETRIIQASYAANAASLIAAIAYTHPFRDLKQAKHILGPIVYSAMSMEIENGDEAIGNVVIDEAISSVKDDLISLLKKYPRQDKRGKMVDELFYRLDNGIVNANR